jgi:hypothetical protein
MVTRLEASRSLLTQLKAHLNSQKPLKVISLISHDDDFRQIRELPPDQQQGYLRSAYIKRAAEIETFILEIEETLGDYAEVLQDDSAICETLPEDVIRAVGTNNLPKIVAWLGPPPVAIERLNAKTSPKNGDCTLFNIAVVLYGNIDVMDILLHYGVDVDQKDSFGITPLCHACRIKNGDVAARHLLLWGASKDPVVGEIDLSKRAEDNEKQELAHLLSTPLGGRRCELFGLERCADLNGMTGVVGRYFDDLEQYAFTFEETNEKARVPRTNLKRRDRTPGHPESVEIQERPKKVGRTDHSISPTLKRKMNLLIDSYQLD